MIQPSIDTLEHRAELQRRTLVTLRVAVVPGQAAVAGTVAVVSLLAKDMLGSDRLAGLGSAAFTFGAALTSIPLAAFMRRRGRRPGLALALGIGSFGSLVAAAGGQTRMFWLFIIGMLLFGSGQAASLGARYAAADLATDDERAKAIGAVVWIGTLGAVFGPLFTPLEKRFGIAIGLDEYVGPYLFAAALFAVGALAYLVFLRPDPLVVSNAVDPTAERARPIKQVRNSFGEIRKSKHAMLGLVAMAGAQASMVGVMDIIEANPRASRTVPFIAKAYKQPYVNFATKVMLGHLKVSEIEYKPDLKGFAIKQPVFSFNKFPNVNKSLGPEMKSTGESILFIDDLKDDQFYELYSRRKMYLTK